MKAVKTCKYTKDQPRKCVCDMHSMAVTNASQARCPPNCSPFSYNNYSVCVPSSFLRLNAGWMRMNLDNNGVSHWNACKIDRYIC